MIKQFIVLASMMLALTACNSPSYYNPNAAVATQQAYAQQAQMDAQQTLQNQYASQAACMSAFSYPGDCTFAGGMWLSPFYYPWGAVIHYNHVVTYGNVVPGYGGHYVHVGYSVPVNYAYASNYVASRRTYYVSHPSSVTVHTTPVVNRVINNPAPINRSTSPQVSRVNWGSSSNSTSRTQPSRVNWGSSSSSHNYSSSSRSYSSSSSSSHRH